MGNRHVLLTVMAAGLTGLSCGGGNDYGEFVAAYCDVFKPCCAAANLFTDGKLCNQLLTAFPPPTFRKAAADACLSDLRAASTQPDFCQILDSQIESCQSLYGHNGDKAPGDACTSSTDCAPSGDGAVTCAFSNSLSAGSKCQVRIRGRAGDTPCLATTGGNTPYEPAALTVTPDRGFLCDVADGLRCDGAGCVPLKAVGDSCMPLGSQECLGTAYCDSMQSVCATRKAAGGPCGSSGYECATGTTCGFGRTCAVLLPNGAACQAAPDCVSTNCEGGACKDPVDLGLVLLCGRN